MPEKIDRRDPSRPYLSVIVPAHRAAGVLRRSLEALQASDLDKGDFELIVVNDGFDAETFEAAKHFADTVVKLPGKPRGPSYARNRGAEIARGEVLVFVDADVCVHPDTLSGFTELFRSEPSVSAAFGSYDDRPSARGLVSRYRNLLHHYVHQTNPGEAETFWAGCGAIRRDAFSEVGMYDEWHFSRPQIEDIEIGRRLRMRGHRIVLRPEIQVCHLKRWRFLEVLLSDLKHRGMPWTRLILHEGPSAGSNTLNVRPLHRWCVILVFLGFGSLLAALIFGSRWPWIWLVPAGSFALVIALNGPFFALLRRAAGWLVMLGSMPLLILFYVASGLSALIGWLAFAVVGPPQPPPDVAAFEEVGVETWPPVPAKPKESPFYYDGR